MNLDQEKFSLYLTALRFLPFKITENLKRIYLDFDMKNQRMILTAFYDHELSELEEELLDDIATNTGAHIPDYSVDYKIKLTREHNADEKHEFVVFSVYEEL
jgi:hypothetical protein